MGDIARFSLKNEDKLYEEFGINAELLIDHAWGYESCTMMDIKSYVPDNNSISSGQVLSEPYDYQKGELIVKEMADSLSLDLVSKGLVTNQIALTIGYDKIDLEGYDGELKKDYIGRNMPKMAHSSYSFDHYTSSTNTIRNAFVDLYHRIMNKKLHMRRLFVVATHVINEEMTKEDSKEYEQLSLFMDYEEVEKNRKETIKKEKEERQLQQAILEIQDKFGKNSVMKAMNKEEGGKTIDRNNQVGGHKA